MGGITCSAPYTGSIQRNTACHRSTAVQLQLSIQGCTTAHGAKGGPPPSAPAMNSLMRVALRGVGGCFHLNTSRAPSAENLPVR